MDAIQAAMIFKRLGTIRNLLIVIVFILLWILLSGCASWTKNEIAAEATWMALRIVDAHQSMGINKNGLEEAGPARHFIGSNPSNDQIIASSAIELILHPLITSWLPRKMDILGLSINPRAAWQYGSIGLSIGVAISNKNNGL